MIALEHRYAFPNQYLLSIAIVMLNKLMKWTFFLKITALTTVTFSSIYGFNRVVNASAFTETALDQTQVIAIARPYGVETTKYDLLVIEQIPNKRQCWQENGADPTLVDPLLLNFDFTGICRRSTDSNGYSIRIDGEDYGLEYLLRLVPKGNELVLVATSRTGKAPELTVGSTRGIASGFMKIQLNPGWQFTKRTYNGKQLGHFYFSTTRSAIFATPPTLVPEVGPAPGMIPPSVFPQTPPPPDGLEVPAVPEALPSPPMITTPPQSTTPVAPSPVPPDVKSPGKGPGPSVNDFRKL